MGLCCGEWHWWVHTLMAINQEWWDTNFSKLNSKFESCRKGVEQHRGGVETFNRFKLFHETYITAAMENLNEIVPAFSMKSPTMLVETCVDNEGGPRHCAFILLFEQLKHTLKAVNILLNAQAR